MNEYIEKHNFVLIKFDVEIVDISSCQHEFPNTNVNSNIHGCAKPVADHHMIEPVINYTNSII